jgi:hypothetical protein
MSEYREMLEQAKQDGVTSEEKMWKSIDAIGETIEKLKTTHPMLYNEFMRNQSVILYGHHFIRTQAEDIVDQMYHRDLNGDDIEGEYYTYEFAIKIVEKYAPNVNVNDMYVALNATYHDWSSLFKKWFNEVNDDRIVQATLQFWFMDEDYDEPNEKVWLYFN